MRKGDHSKGTRSRSVDNAGSPVDWELRPGGMLVQVRDPIASSALTGPIIRVRVSYGVTVHEVSIAAHSTFGELKKVLVHDTGLHPKQQRLLYRGKVKDSRDYLRDAGVKEKSKIVLVEDSASWEKRLIEIRKDEAMEKAHKVIKDANKEADKAASQISTLQAAVLSGKKLAGNEFTRLSDKLMYQLVQLDGVKVEGDAKVQKNIVERRLQKHLEGLDALKKQNDTSNQHGNPVITTASPAVDGSSSFTTAPPSTYASSMADWERFD